MKRKINDGERDELVQLKRRRLLSFPELVDVDDHALASSSSTNASTEELTITDLQEVNSGGVELEITATFNVELIERNQTTSFDKLEVEETKLEPSMEETKKPSDAELEEFFSAAEKDIQNQFSKKYNFDIVNEESLEGRFEWVQVNP